MLKRLIETFTENVNKGMRLVGDTGKSLDRFMSRVAEINAIVAEIAAAAAEQATGPEEINKAINQMDDVTQKNAAMVKESTAAIHTLAEETKNLAELVGQFHTEPAVARSQVGGRRTAA